jgi:hypothetical protein
MGILDKLQKGVSALGLSGLTPEKYQNPEK